MDLETQKQWQEWIESRPPSVQQLAAKFPPESKFVIHGVRYYLLGYTEDEVLIVTKVNPALEYESAMESKEYVHASHFTLEEDHDRTEAD